jgi:hypothetical protein
MCTLHWSNTSHLKHEPAEHLVVLCSFIIVRDLAFRVIVLSQVQHNGPRLKHSHLAICEGWNPPIGVDCGLPRPLDGGRKHDNSLALVGQSQFFKNNAGLEAIWGDIRVKC